MPEWNESDWEELRRSMKILHPNASKYRGFQLFRQKTNSKCISGDQAHHAEWYSWAGHPFIPVPCSVGIGKSLPALPPTNGFGNPSLFWFRCYCFSICLQIANLRVATCGKLILTQSDPILTNKSKQSWTHVEQICTNVEQICTNIMAAPCGPPEHPNPWGSLSSVASGKQYARVVTGDFFAKKQLLTKMLSAVSTAGNTLRYLDSTCQGWVCCRCHYGGEWEAASTRFHT